MMPNITRGDRVGGLMAYLAGPGKANEHTEPHLVGGDPAMMAWHDDNELGRNDALVIGRHLDRPRRAFGVEVPGGHVWHCSLSLSAEEGQLTDERWGAIAERFVAKMGLDDAEGSKAPTRWVALRHGLSGSGNDHVHLVVNLVREDGTKASIHNDRPRSQTVCRQLETEYGLQELESTDRGRSSRGYHPAEVEADARRRARGRFEGTRRKGTETRTWTGLSKGDRDGLIDAQRTKDQPRWALARAVRGCATAATDEAEFVRRMRGQGVLVRARLAEGTQDVITGYSAAMKPEPGQRPIWYGGGQLGRDLTLPRLRAEWPDTPQGASEAAAEWNAARRHRRPVAPGRETREPDAGLWQQAEQDLSKLREQLRAVPIEDRQRWARVARHSAGAFAAWSQRVEDTPGPLAATADALARSAELRDAPVRPEPGGRVSITGAAFLLAAVAKSGGRGVAVQIMMLQQLATLTKALHDMHVADGDARRAAQIAGAVRGQLTGVSARLEAMQPAGAAAPTVAAPAADGPGAEAVRRAQTGQMPATRAPGSPIPNKLEQDQERARRARQDERTGRQAGREGR